VGAGLGVAGGGCPDAADAAEVADAAAAADADADAAAADGARSLSFKKMGNKLISLMGEC